MDKLRDRFVGFLTKALELLAGWLRSLEDKRQGAVHQLGWTRNSHRRQMVRSTGTWHIHPRLAAAVRWEVAPYGMLDCTICIMTTRGK